MLIRNWPPQKGGMNFKPRLYRIIISSFVLIWRHYVFFFVRTTTEKLTRVLAYPVFFITDEWNFHKRGGGAGQIVRISKSIKMYTRILFSLAFSFRRENLVWMPNKNTNHNSEDVKRIGRKSTWYFVWLIFFFFVQASQLFCKI